MDGVCTNGNAVIDDQNNGKAERVAERDGTGDGQSQLRWEYELSRARWIQFEREIEQKLNENIANDMMEFEKDESKLQVNFSTMKQKNLHTGFVRSVRCAVRNNDGEHRVWEYIDTKRRWRSMNPQSVLTLERAFNDAAENVTISISGTTFIADFEKSIIKSVNGSTEHKMRWQISKAEPSVAANPVPRIEHIRAAKRIAAQAEISATASKRKVKEENEGEKTKVENGNKEVQDGDSKTSCGEEKKSGIKKRKETNSSVDNNTKIQTKKVLLKGVAPVDPECHDLLGIAHVHTEFNNVYDALLNQTNAQNNYNKYFIIQLLKSDTESRYWVWYRWGRVGYKGQTSLNPCGTDLEQAKSLFCNKFKDKTKNDWAERASFTQVDGKYDYLPVDYSKLIEKHEKTNGISAQGEKATVESKLDPSLQHLLKLICDVRAMEETVMELEYDATKAPLGKITEEQINIGYAALKEIEKFIKNKDFSPNFVRAVNNYYTKIPHFFGMRQPPLIKTIEQLKAEIKLLEALSEIGMAVRTFKKESGMDVHPIDRHYMNMKCQISLIHNENHEFKLVENYLLWTHAPTHNLYRIQMRCLYAVNREGERERFMFDLGNRKLLWHGSRQTNWYGILSQGLRIAPPEAPVTGYMFGKGIYFADMVTKSANYCYPQANKPGFLVLAQVALGEVNELLSADHNADKLPPGKHSTKGLGSCGPDPDTFVTLEDGCEVPCGKPITLSTKDQNYVLNYNEYIVYDVKQVWIRYLVEVDFIF